VIAGAFGIFGLLICLLALRQHRRAVRSMLGEHKVECAEQIEQLRRSIAMPELQLVRPGKIGLRETQLIARISRIVSLE
jgi:hypothetical protein